MNQNFRPEMPTPQKIRAIKTMAKNKVETTKNLKTWLFLAVTSIALIFTGLTSYSLLYRMTLHRGEIPAIIAAVTGILLTDGMLLYWTLIGFRKADSGPQRITAALMAALTVTAIGIFGIGEQMLADSFVTPLQMRYIVTASVIAQIIGVSIYELSSYEARLSMATYALSMKTIQLLDKATAEEADSFADVILAEAEARATHAYQIAGQVRRSTQQNAPALEATTQEPKPQEAPTNETTPPLDSEREPLLVKMPEVELVGSANGSNPSPKVY